MKKLTTLLGVAILMSIAGAGFAADKYPPGPAYRTCPDTLTIFDLQQADTTIAPCHPAVLDTVLGIRGIVIGFDAKPTGFAFYIQQPAGGPYTGIDVFTGSTNYGPSTPLNLQLGDDVVVYGRTQEFPAVNGESEIEGYDGVQGTPDLTIRRISTGNALPPYFISSNPNDINWIPGASGNQGEKYEGCLVRMRGPFVVRRINTSGTLAGLPANMFLMTTPTGTDSICVDGTTLTTIAPPAVGTTVDSIQGIPNQRTSGPVNSYRIQIRDGNDLFLAVPPNLVDAYPIEDNQLRLVFDRNVNVATAENEINYSLGSAIDGSTVDLATVDGGAGRNVTLTITSARTDGDFESVTAANISSATCPTCLMGSQQRNFVNGVMPIAMVQAADPSMLPLFDDRSLYAGTGTAPGTKFTTRGVCTGIYGALYYIQTEGSGAPAGPLRSGISIFAPSAPLIVGHKYRVTGQVQEFDRESEIVSTVDITDEGLGSVNPPLLGDLSVITDTTQNVADDLTGEDYEGMLVKLDHVRITENRTVGQSWFVTGHREFGTDTLLVSNLNGVLNAYDSPDSASIMDIVGVVHYAAGIFRVCPRSAADITDYGVLAGVEEGTLSLALKVSPNPARIANVTFALPKKGVVDISVFDLSGRKINTIAKGSFDPGTHSRRWDGTDAAGNRVPAGVYFYSYKVGGQELKTRSVILN